MSKERISLPLPSGVLYAEFFIPNSDKDASFYVGAGFACEESFDKALKSFKLCVYREADGADARIEIPWGFKYINRSQEELWRVNGVARFDIMILKRFKEKYFVDFMKTVELPFGTAHYLYAYDENGKGIGEALRAELLPKLNAIFSDLDEPSIKEFKSAIDSDSDFKAYREELYGETTLKLNEVEVLVCERCSAPTPEDMTLSRSDLADQRLGSVLAVLSSSSRGTAFVVRKKEGESESELYLLCARHVIYEERDGALVPRLALRASFKNSVSEYQITPIAPSYELDIALCKIVVPSARANGADEITLVESKKEARVGADVVLLGNDLGKSLVPLFGHIIQLDYNHEHASYLRCDTPANAGSSGGPLLLANGRCIGVHSLSVNLNDNDLVRGASLFVPLYTSKAKTELSALLACVEEE